MPYDDFSPYGTYGEYGYFTPYAYMTPLPDLPPFDNGVYSSGGGGVYVIGDPDDGLRHDYRMKAEIEGAPDNLITDDTSLIRIDQKGNGITQAGAVSMGGDNKGQIKIDNSINVTNEVRKKRKELLDQIDELNKTIKWLVDVGESNSVIYKQLLEQYNAALAQIDDLGVQSESDKSLIEGLKAQKASLEDDIKSKGVRISDLEKSNKELQSQSKLYQDVSNAFLLPALKYGRQQLQGYSDAEMNRALDPTQFYSDGPVMPYEGYLAPTADDYVRWGNGTIRGLDAESFLKDYSDPELYSDKYKRIQERRRRGYDRLASLGFAEADLRRYQVNTADKLTRQYIADNYDVALRPFEGGMSDEEKAERNSQIYAEARQGVKDAKAAGREGVREARLAARSGVSSARSDMANLHALGGTLLSDYNSAGWRFDGEDDSWNFTRFGKFIRGLAGDNPVFNLMNQVYNERRVEFANAKEDNKSEWEKDAWGPQKKWVEKIDLMRSSDNDSKLRDMWLKVGEWVDNGFTKEGYEDLKNEIEKSGLNDLQKESFNERIEKAKEWYDNNIVKKGHDFGFLLRSFQNYYDHPYNSALSQTGAAGQTGQEPGAGDNEEIKIVSEPLEEGEIIDPLPAGDRVETDAGSETETAATQTGASSFIPYDNTDVDFEALYDPDGEYMKAIKWIEANPDSELARDLLADINGGKYGPLNGHAISMANLRQLATDSKRGPVHNAVMGLIGGESPLWKDEKYKYESAPWVNVVVNDDPNGDGKETGKTEKEKKTEQVTQEGDVTKVNTDPLTGKNNGEETQRGLPTWMRYAPIAASALGLFNPQLYRKDYTNANFLRNMANSLPDRKVRFRENLAKMRYTPVDRNMLTNTQNANMAAAMRGASGSNAGNAMAYNLALLRSGNEAIGSQYAQTATANNQMYNQAMQFNSAVNQANAQGNFNAQQTNAQLGQQRDAMRNNLMSQYVQYREASDNGRNKALSTQLNSLSNNLGELGKEFYNRNAVAGLPFVNGTDLNGNPYYRGQQAGSGFQVPFVLFPQTQAAQTAQAAAPADGSVTLTKEQAEKLTPELKAQLGIPMAYGSFLRPYYRRA